MISYYAGISCKIKEIRRISIPKLYSILVICLILAVWGGGRTGASFAQTNGPAGDKEAICQTMEIFPLVSQHVHGSGGMVSRFRRKMGG